MNSPGGMTMYLPPPLAHALTARRMVLLFIVFPPPTILFLLQRTAG
jgi:hypothetical protein